MRRWRKRHISESEIIAWKRNPAELESMKKREFLRPGVFYDLKFAGDELTYSVTIYYESMD